MDRLELAGAIGVLAIVAISAVLIFGRCQSPTVRS